MGDPNRKLTAGEEGVLRRLRRIYEPLGGVVEEGPRGLAVRFDARRIAIQFGPVSGHR